MQPLEGIRVLAIENYVAGPFGSMLLADHGAEVVKIEPPDGDVYRRAEPILRNEHGEMTYSFLRVNRNKKSVVLNLKSPDDRLAFLDLVDDADVIWENLGPGAMDRLGLGWDILHKRNDRVIYASISGFGRPDVLPSPYQNRPAFDIVAQALSGIMSRVGQDPQPPLFLGVPIADELTGIVAVLGVALALVERASSGRGRRVDISMYDSLLLLNEQSVGYYSAYKRVPPRGASATAAPYGVFRSLDGWFVVGVASNSIFSRFCDAIGAPELLDDPRLSHGVDRAKVQESLLRPRIEAWAEDKGAEEASSILTAHGVPAAKVQDTADLFGCPHIEARKMLVNIDDPVFGSIELVASPIKFDAEPNPSQTAPQLGADQKRYFSSGTIPHGEQ